MDTVQAYLRSRAEEDTPGLKSGDRTWTWREYVAEAGARANAVRELLAGDRPPHVGVLLENTPEMAFALAAAALGGYVTVGINLTRRGTGLAADIIKADCQVLLTDSRHLPLLDGLDLHGARVIDTDGADWASRVVAGAGPVRAARDVAAMDTFMLIFTSGTSGAPKAVPVPNAIVVLSGAKLADRFGIVPQDTCYQAMPMFHSNAILAGYAVAVCAGAAMALAPKFSATSFLSDVRRYDATYMNYVGKPLAYILRTPRRDDDADNPLRVAFGNEAADRDIAEFAERFGTIVWDGFGATETAVFITREPGTPPGSVGVPMDGVAVYDRATRTECPRATFDATGRVTNLDEAVGELVNTQGAGFFQGYYNDPEATDQRLDAGMYWSGDLAYRDDAGYVYLAGRTTDWLRVDGENLAAGMIEQILMRHPAVNRVAVYGIPDPDAGDQLVAALVLNRELNDGIGVDAAAFGQSFAAFLAAQEDLSTKGWPRYVRVADDLPSTATNKVLKSELVRQGLDFADPCWVRAERGTTYQSRPAPPHARRVPRSTAGRAAGGGGYGSLDRGQLAVLLPELLLCGQLIDRSGMAWCLQAWGREEMTRIAIEEWAAASPIYTRRMQRALGYEGDDVVTIFKGLQLDIGAPPQFMDFRYTVHDRWHGEFHLNHCGALMDVEPLGPDYVRSMCHDIEDPTFDATAVATNARARVRPVHRPPRTPADRHPHCAWTVVIDDANPALAPTPACLELQRTRAATAELDPIDGSGDGAADYAGALLTDVDFTAFSRSALIRMAGEVVLQMHLLNLGFVRALRRRADAVEAQRIATKQLVGIAGITAERLHRALGLPADASGALRVLELHPLLNPSPYVAAERTGDVLSVARSPAHDDGGWLTLCGPASPQPLRAIVRAVDARFDVDVRGSATDWRLRVTAGAEPAREFDEVAVTRISTGAGFRFQPRRSLPIVSTAP